MTYVKSMADIVKNGNKVRKYKARLVCQCCKKIFYANYSGRIYCYKCGK